jgi:pimeloyl-ACP methyl ester carboxylesterase
MTSFTTRDGVDLVYEDSGTAGDGVPLVMLHGWGRPRRCSATSSPSRRRDAAS